MARRYFTVASFKARNLVNPGVTYYGNKKYSQKAYDDKLTWLAEQLYRMNADFVGLQEIFHGAPGLGDASDHGQLWVRLYAEEDD